VRFPVVRDSIERYCCVAGGVVALQVAFLVLPAWVLPSPSPSPHIRHSTEPLVPALSKRPQGHDYGVRVSSWQG